MINLKKGELCPACQKGKLDEIKKDLTFTYKKKQKDFQSVIVFTCELCGYEGLTKTANKKIEKELTDFRRSVDGLLIGNELKRIREMLGLNKKNMAWLLHVNAKTVGRYENGKITQSYQIDRLYRIFHIYPSAIHMFLNDTLETKPLPIDSEFRPISSNQTSISEKGKLSATINNTYIRHYEDHSATSSI